ncbi:hypothetical protein BRETT_004641 [Brettanomyces bruxellensis]|uniref:PhoD-like phosphatase domain-containing protein n=1 Tax=Dekkera bruxellensis TaxID=5007 RepID=A0A871R159_DEKBR|nr:uncharacterized protein BRETT_004641 [Brettanomyces bruxellensis]QOU19993.1 hypothetical protein BRETT_004641 [Brettanomyces bruxellensis]
MCESKNNGWFEPIPSDQYQKLVEKAIPKNIQTVPDDEIVGQPAIHVACGPNIRFLGCLEGSSNNYRASILLVTRKKPERTTESKIPEIIYKIGRSSEPEIQDMETDCVVTGNFPGKLIYQEEDYLFYRYAVNLNLKSYEQKVEYAINSEFRSDYMFYLPAIEQSMNIMSYSCNGFSLGADISTFKGSLWLDVLRKHNKLHYHVMIGGGDQIYCDSIKFSSPEFRRWLKHIKKHSLWKMSSSVRASLDHYYLNHYVEWFGKGYMEISLGKTCQILFPKVMHQIPQVNMFDDHDIIDGFGSYSKFTMSQSMFKGVGSSAFKYYMLFQHHTFPKEDVSIEKSWILGTTPGPYIQKESRSVYARLGKEIAMIALDCRTERTKKQICTESTYNHVFSRLEREISSSKGEIKHLLVQLGVPICYPRMVWAEVIMESPILYPLKWIARKGWIFKGLVNEFDGSVELLDDLNDHWCARHHKAERNRFVSRLMKFGAEHGIRLTILSGDVHLCCFSRLYTCGKKVKQDHIPKTAAEDPRLIINVISSAIVNTPPPNGMATMLQKRSKLHTFDLSTKEDVIPLFKHKVQKPARGNELFFNSRNFSDLILVKNLTHDQQKYFKNFKQGDLIKAGPISELEVVTPPSDKCDCESTPETHNAYPLHPDSLLTSLHVEIDRENTSSETQQFQLLIPALNGKHKLEHVGDKHW